MKKHEIIFSIIKVPIEFLTIFFLFFIAYDIRRVTDLIPRVQLPIPPFSTEHLLGFALVGAFLYVAGFAVE